MELHGKNMKEMEISDKSSLVGWYVRQNGDHKNFSSDFFFFGKLFEGSARDLIKKFNVKTRAYYGNTSMDSEMSLLMANQTLVS